MPPTAPLPGAPRFPGPPSTHREIPADAMANLYILAPWLPDHGTRPGPVLRELCSRGLHTRRLTHSA